MRKIIITLLMICVCANVLIARNAKGFRNDLSIGAGYSYVTMNEQSISSPVINLQDFCIYDGGGSIIFDFDIAIPTSVGAGDISIGREFYDFLLGFEAVFGGGYNFAMDSLDLTLGGGVYYSTFIARSGSSFGNDTYLGLGILSRASYSFTDAFFAALTLRLGLPFVHFAELNNVHDSIAGCGIAFKAHLGFGFRF